MKIPGLSPALAFAFALALPVAALATTSAIPLRGVVEGFYGRPWGTEGRLSMLKFMGQEKMNVFVYGPKDDPYHHKLWREPYPAKEMADFSRLLACAKENGVQLYWAVHLGDAFRGGDVEADYEALFRKLGWMYDGGFRSFAIFFDDFGNVGAEVHAAICNRVVREFISKRDGCTPLLMCPYAYYGTGQRYQRVLGEKLDPSVNIMWTGRYVCTDVLAEDVEKITADFRRPPFIWWNWPVNDYCRGKLLLGRTYGCDAAKYAGFVSNPMENVEASKIALHGVAAWCLDPENFDSRKNWEESFSKLYPDPEIAAAMRIFAEHNSDQGGKDYRREESFGALPLIARVQSELDVAGRLRPRSENDLRALFGQVRAAANTLLKKLPKDSGLGWELEGWLSVEACLMETGIKALDCLAAKDDAARKAALADIDEIRRRSDAASSAHMAKFTAATFPDDRKRIVAPQPSAYALAPLVNTLEALAREHAAHANDIPEIGCGRDRK